MSADLVSDAQWMAAQVRSLPHEKVILEVSEWAEANRIMPPDLSPKPGPWECSYTPYMIEPMNCLSARSVVQFIAMMKAHQMGATVAMDENWIGYTIGHCPGPMMFVSAEADLAQETVELRVDRMIRSSGLADKIGSADPRSRKSGNTATKKEFPGGHLIVAGAQNPNKLRNFGIRYLICNEIDAWPLYLKNEGKPLGIVEKRTSAYERNRKVLYESTPLVKQTSEIYRLFKEGDQRHYHIPCPRCGFMQPLRWEGYDDKRRRYGITYELDADDILIESSVAMICRECFGEFYDYEKDLFLGLGKWIPSARPKRSKFRSYHLPGMLSPMHSWTEMVIAWMRAWDVPNNRMRDREELRNFYNLELGEPFEERGEAPRFERVVQHRRFGYQSDMVPNAMAVADTGGPVVLLTCVVDVHPKRLDVEIVGWCEGRQTYSIRWEHLDAISDSGIDVIEEPGGPWDRLTEILVNERWTADDGRVYKIVCTMIDASFSNQIVHDYCDRFQAGGVFPVMGRQAISGAKYTEYSNYTTAKGSPGFNVNITRYKDQLAGWLKAEWYQGKLQPEGYPNYPEDYRDDFFRQYEAEEKVEKLDNVTGRRIGMYWRKIGNRDNHAWDCRVYALAAFDILVLDHCERQGVERADYELFFFQQSPVHNDGASMYSWAPGTDPAEYGKAPPAVTDGAST